MDENYISLERSIERMYEVTEECGTESIFIDRIIDELQNLPSSPHICIHPQWIPVSERLPDPFIIAHVYDCTMKMVTDAYMTRHKEWVGVRMNHEVTHWMPLPEPPKEDV